MGATLRYAKIIDREEFQRHGAEVKPNLESIVHLDGAPPAKAVDFHVIRSWTGDFDAFTETWRIADPHGMTVRQPVDREVLAGHGEIADEIAGQHFDYADTGYQLIIEVDGREVARADFEVRDPDPDGGEAG